MLDKFAEQNKQARTENDFVMPDELEKAYKDFVQQCLLHRITKTKNGRGLASDFIDCLMENRAVTLSNLTGLTGKVTNVLASEVVIDHFNELAAKQASEMDRLERIHY